MSNEESLGHTDMPIAIKIIEKLDEFSKIHERGG
jgi:hypothetical protein